MDIPAIELKAMKVRDAKFDQADVNGSDSDYPEQCFEEMNKPSSSRLRGKSRRRKLLCGRGCGGNRQQARSRTTVTDIPAAWKPCCETSPGKKTRRDKESK